MMPQLNSIWCHSWTLYSIFNGHYMMPICELYMMPNRLTNGRQIVTHSLVLALISMRPYMVSNCQSFPCFGTHSLVLLFIPLFCHSFLWDHIWSQIVNHSLVLLLIYYTYTTVPVWITVATVMYTGTVSTVHSILRVRYQLFIVYYGYCIYSADNWKTIGRHLETICCLIKTIW